jgi:hypothetical protein
LQVVLTQLDEKPFLVGDSMASLSTFELLTKSLIPAPFDQVGSGRVIIQGYFLTIANIGNQDARLKVKFTSNSPTFLVANIVAFLDRLGVDNQPVPIPPLVGNSVTLEGIITAGDTGLLILQPNVTDPALLAAANIEIRGFVDISPANPASNGARLLVTPEHRGTFLPKDVDLSNPNVNVGKDFDQLVYPLPSAEGKALFIL